MRNTFEVGGVQYRIDVATDRETRQEAYELVYQLYHDQGYTGDLPCRIWCSVYNLLPDTVTLVVTREEEMVGTLTVVFDGELGLPADKLYKQEIRPLRRPGRYPSEIISLGVREDVGRRASREILVKLFNYVYLTAWYIRKSTDFIITVNPHHADYYRKTLLFEYAGEEKTYEKVGGAPAVLLHLALEVPTEAVGVPESEHLRERTHYRYFHSRFEERLILPALQDALESMSESEFEYFAMDRTDIWNQAGESTRDVLSSYYLTALMAREGAGTPFAEPSGADHPHAIGPRNTVKNRRLSWHIWSFSMP